MVGEKENGGLRWETAVSDLGPTGWGRAKVVGPVSWSDFTTDV